MDNIKDLIKELKEDRKAFYELCKKEIVGIEGVRSYAKGVIETFSTHLNKFPLENICIFASGGLGRGEISFDSDLDLVFLYKNNLSRDKKTFIETLISSLWDCGLEVGQQVSPISRLISLAKEDFTVLTSVLETKFLGGDKKLYRDFNKKFFKRVGSRNNKKSFLKKLKEHRDERIKKYGESIYLIEPNIKEGLGGIRDIHCLKWGSIVYLNTSNLTELKSLEWINEDELKWILNGYDFLWRTRIQLHLIGGTRKEQLTLQDQHTIAKLMGFSDGEFISSEESFMRMYYTHSSRIKRVTNFFIEKLFYKFIEKRKNKKQKIISGPFIVTGNLITFKNPEDIHIRPEILMELFWNAARLRLNFHHDTGRIVRDNLNIVEKIRSNKKVISMFFDILLNEDMSFDILKSMHEIKFLDTFIPEFLHLRYRVQYDTYHTYTVDEHLLRTVKELHNLKRNDYSYLFEEDINIKVLFMAALIHDIGKGYGKNHSKIGAKLAKEIANRMYFTEDETELLCFLVENHLLLAETALKRDIEDEKPVERCAVKIGSLKRLHMLFLLQIADSIATGERAWNPWRETLLNELFVKIKNIFKQEKLNGEDIYDRIERVKDRVLLGVALEEKELVKKWMEELSIRYILSQSPQDIYLHYKLEKEFKDTKEVVLHLRPLESGIWEFIFVGNDHPRLFDFITGLLWINGVNILSADIFTRRYNIIVDVIKVENIPDPFNISKFCERIKYDLMQLITGKYQLDDIYKKKCYMNFHRPKYFKKRDKVIINEEASDFYTIIEVYTWERPGVLHTISKVLHEFDLDIKLAKITTPGEQVVDVFYVTTRDGEKIIEQSVHQKIQESLLRALKEIS